MLRRLEGLLWGERGLEVVALAFSSSLLATLLSSLALARLFEKIGHTGVDVHKPCRREVPESVGLALAVGLAFSMTLVYAESGDERALALLASVAIASAIGLLDDFKTLPAYAKIILGAAPAIPVLALELYVPRPLIPLDGFARLTLLYPLLIPLAYTVATNGFNMYDAYNGVMLSTAAISLTALAFIAAMQAQAGIEESAFGVYASAATLAATLALLALNFYPARAFNGDAGSFALGAAYASIAVMGRLEAAAVLLALPVGLNGFLKIASVGFRERRSFEKPVYLDGWLVRMRRNARAMSLYTLILSRTPLSEPEILAVSVVLSWASSLLAIATMYLTLARLAG